MNATELTGPVRVGDVVVEPVYDGYAVLAPEMWSNADWTEHQHLIDADGRVVVPVGGFLVRHGGRTVLFDAGSGVVNDEMFVGGAMLDSLAALGCAPGDIDTVVVSHLHSDHIGWLGDDGVPTFPNATIRIGAADWEHFVTSALGGRRRASRLEALSDHVELIDHDATPIAPGITSMATPGHTPGHTSSVISSGDERLIVLGDALHCPAQLTETEWEFLYDVDKALAVSTRQALVRRAAEPGTAILPCHFPGMSSARLVPATGERHWVFD